MAVGASVLAEGQLPDTKGTILTASAVTYVTFISIVNTSATPQTVELYHNASGTSRFLFRVASFAQYERILSSDRIVLESGDLIEAATTTATAVDYVITGGADV
jgi:hypothetical protein